MRNGSKFIEMPRETWEQHIAQAPRDCSQILSFMTEEHHLIRYFVVRALPHIGKPIPPELISDELKMPLSMTNNILDDLERNLFFWFAMNKVKC